MEDFQQKNERKINARDNRRGREIKKVKDVCLLTKTILARTSV
jgi:hypothetical protein